VHASCFTTAPGCIRHVMASPMLDVLQGLTPLMDRRRS
jgi:hypothetical protein